MAPRGAAAIQMDAPSAHRPIVLSARLADWPGLCRLFVPRRKYLSRWTEDAPARVSDSVRTSENTSSLRELVEADLQIMFGEVWDLVRTNPRAASAILGLVVGYVLWG